MRSSWRSSAHLPETHASAMLASAPTSSSLTATGSVASRSGRRGRAWPARRGPTPRPRGARAPPARAATRPGRHRAPGRATAHSAQRRLCGDRRLIGLPRFRSAQRAQEPARPSGDAPAPRTARRSTPPARPRTASGPRRAAHARTRQPPRVSLCAPRGPGRAGTRPCESFLVQRALRRIERRPGEPERRRRSTDRLALDPRAADHLVLHLHQIARVQELRAGELLIAHRLRPRIQAPRLPQRPHLRILTSSRHHAPLNQLSR